jgi:dihydroxyacid dehydratase/phosphogluconate dehydratase
MARRLGTKYGSNYGPDKKEEDDLVHINISESRLELELYDKVREERRKNWQLPATTQLEKGSLLERYRRVIGSATRDLNLNNQ